MPPKHYWTLMGRLRAVPAVTSEYTSLNDSLESGGRVVAMFEHLGLLHNDAVTLQIGCGIGRIEYHLCKRVRFCYGVDIGSSMIQKARANVSAPNVRFLCNDGLGLGEFGDSTLDLVYSIFVFQHLPRDVVDIYVRDSFKKLVTGGRFVFQMMVDDLRLQPEPPATHPYGLRYYTRGEVRRLLETAGFGELTIYDFESWEPDAGAKAGDLLFVATKPAI
jgi:SAM-dependent methyltransferase